MPEKDPNNYAITTYLFVFWLAMWGGLIRFFRGQIYKNEPIPWKKGRFWVQLFFELMVSAFVGIVAFYICEAVELSQPWTAAFVAISGHEGGRAMSLIMRLIESRAK